MTKDAVCFVGDRVLRRHWGAVMVRVGREAHQRCWRSVNVAEEALLQLEPDQGKSPGGNAGLCSFEAKALGSDAEANLRQRCACSFSIGLLFPFCRASL
jgi:hypothetical protein